MVLYLCSFICFVLMYTRYVINVIITMGFLDCECSVPRRVKILFCEICQKACTQARHLNVNIEVAGVFLRCLLVVPPPYIVLLT